VIRVERWRGEEKRQRIESVDHGWVVKRCAKKAGDERVNGAYEASERDEEDEITINSKK